MRRYLRACVSAAFVLILLAWTAAPVLAAEGAEPSPADSTAGWIFRWLNFLIVFGGGGYLIAKHAPAVFRRRAETIVAAITEAARVKEDSELRRQEAESKLAGLQQEIAALRAAARRDAQADAERIRALARAEAERIDLAAEAEILAAERAARMELRRLGGRQAIERAEAQLRREMTPAADAGLFRSFVAEIRGSAN